MTEVLRYGLIGAQDIRTGDGTFEVELADGRIVTLDELSGATAPGLMILPSYTLSGLPPAGTVWRMARVTDNIRGIWRDTGTSWESVTGYADPADWGAVADGATDDFAALSAMAADLRAIGSNVKVRFMGQYVSSDLLNFTTISNLTIDGYGATITFTKTAAAGRYFFRVGNFTDTTVYSNIKIYGLTLTLNRAPTAVTDSGMMSAKYADDLVIQHTRVLRADVQGIYATNGSRVKLLNNFVGSKTNGGADKIEGDGIFTDSVDNLEILGNFVGNTNDDGIFTTRATTRSKNVTINGNTVENVTIGAGIRAQSIDGLEIIGNTVRNTGDPGIDASEESPSWPGVINFSIVGNTIIDPGQNPGATGTAKDGINALGAAHGTIGPNTIRNAKRLGVEATKGSVSSPDGTDVVISKNVITLDADGGNNGTDGIGIQAINLSRLSVHDNIIFNPGSNGIQVKNDATGNVTDVSVLDNIVINARKSTGGLTTAGVHFFKTSSGLFLSSYVDGNIIRDSRSPVVTDYWFFLEGGGSADYVELGRRNVSNLPISGGYPLVTRIGSNYTFTGGTGEQTVRSMTVFGKTLGTVGTLHIHVSGRSLGNNDTKTWRVKFGGTTVYTFTTPASASAVLFDLEITMVATASETSQKWFANFTRDTNTVVMADADTTVDTTADQTLAFTGQLANAADTIESWNWVVKRD